MRLIAITGKWYRALQLFEQVAQLLFDCCNRIEMILIIITGEYGRVVLHVGGASVYLAFYRLLDELEQGLAIFALGSKKPGAGVNRAAAIEIQFTGDILS